MSSPQPLLSDDDLSADDDSSTSSSEAANPKRRNLRMRLSDNTEKMIGKSLGGKGPDEGPDGPDGPNGGGFGISGPITIPVA